MKELTGGFLTDGVSRSGEINSGEDLETILFRINMYKNDIKKIKEAKPNPNF